MRKWLGRVVAGVVAAAGVVGGLTAQGIVLPSRGETLFENRCARCHGIGGTAEDGIAPRLIGVVGRPIASRTDFLYSDALKAQGGSWTPERIDAFITDSAAFAPGTEMDVRSPDPAERAAIIGYLGSLK